MINRFGGFVDYSYICINNQRMKAGLLKHSDAIKFILAGNSTFTFLNTKTGNRFTYSVKKHKENPIFFVKVLTGPENYTFVGTVRLC